MELTVNETARKSWNMPSSRLVERRGEEKEEEEGYLC